MTETDRRQQRLITSTPQLTAEEIASRSFSTGFRGYAEGEVRGFLKRVSEQLAAAHEREHELEAAVDALEDQLSKPAPLDEQQLLDALGEETAHLLRSAREAGENIRRKAEEHASEVMEGATSAAAQMRGEAENVLAVRTTEADDRVAEIISAAESRVKEMCDGATANADATIESARSQGRVMLDEAKAARERVLGDLVRRRALLNAQIEVLRNGRDQLLDAYRTVKRAFLEATEALAAAEARVAEERSSTAVEPLDVAAEIAAEIEALDGDEHDHNALESEATTPGALTAGDDGLDAELGDHEGSFADVDSLFARLRSGSGTETDSNGAIESHPADTAKIEEPIIDLTEDEADTVGEPRVTPSEWRELRARAVDPTLVGLVKKAKRVAQDDQNALLDAVRRHKGRPAAAQVLPDLDELLDSWARVLHDAVSRAYGAGGEAAGVSDQMPDDALAAREAADAVVSPLRLRLTVAIDSGDGGDAGGLVERIGARYREWKNQSLESSLAESLAFAWARGVYDAVPDAAVLWWVPFEEGRCSDCDDNALEPTVKGKEFPTGQMFPPAHPGCRCLLAPAEILNAPTASA